MAMDCPLCEAPSKVLESRRAEAGAATRRRRHCTSCGHRFTTYERREDSLRIRKRSGAGQPFDRAKLHGALARAAHKRPVSDAQIDAIADAVEAALRKAGGELPSDAIGQLCLQELAAIDRGAYLQFAGTLPSQEDLRHSVSPEFAGSFEAGSVRPASNPPESRS
jgi:transcriptional repressor NrdR